jgi:putative cell wall-binding protein
VGIRRTVAATLVAAIGVATSALVPRAVGAETTAATYTNPVVGRDSPDPFVLRVGATYVAYTTNEGGENVPVLTSTDLAHWTHTADALPQLPAWAGPGRNWSPSVLAVDATHYVLYYTALDAAAGHQCIGVATSARPTGPFTDAGPDGQPLMCQLDRAGSIDPSVFRDAAGNPWLTWKSEPHFAGKPALIWTQQLTRDGTRLVGDGVPILDATQPWERGIVEAPSMLPAFGRYFLFYSGGTWDSADYAVSYAVCDSPSGPCRKPSSSAILARNDALGIGGPGGAEVFTDATGAWWLAYHAWTLPAVGYPGGARTMRLERIAFVNGRPVVSGPTVGPETTRRAERVAGADRYATAAAFSAATYAPGVPVVYVAAGDAFPDALAAAPAAGAGGGPVLLVDAFGVPAATAGELRRLAPAKVVVVGAAGRRPGIVATIQSLVGANVPVTTVAGVDRYATAALVSAGAFAPGVPVVYVATGLTFPDALAAGAAGARRGGPVLLVDGDVPSAVAAELRRLRPESVVVLGGTNAVGEDVVAGIRDVLPTTTVVARLAGADRYATAAALSRATYAPGEPVALVATGTTFADALTAGTAKTPLLLVGATVPPETHTELDRLGSAVTVLGGEAAVGSRLFAALDLR